MDCSTKLCSIMKGWKPFFVMILVQLSFTGMNVFYRLAINDNMKMSILIAYRSIFGAAFIIPIALIKEKNVRPKLTWTILFQAFFCGLLGLTIPQNLYTASMNLTSATIPAAMANLSPAMTFILAIIFRLEALKLGTTEGKLKVLGTTIGIGGAMLVTFYKGVDIPMWQTHFLHVGHHHQGPATDRPVFGSLLAILSYVAYSSWLIIQTKMSQKYPCQYSCTALVLSMAAIQAVVFALCTERDWSQWRLGCNIRLYTALYAGIVHSGVTTTLIAWCVNVRGPLFVSIFNPVGLVLVAFAATILLNEKLHLGTVIGSVLIAMGLYFVLWGKSKEMKKMMKCSSESEAMKVVVSAHP
ncbi:hypothetical protein MKW92_011767 [Papaver armeniacum]|nr:hypothetical protein MKW92_047472 [Papaver armeniacum]KAI3961356.1 hypothetical protein MKW92_011767 [Papaver armeniacum]